MPWWIWPIGLLFLTFLLGIVAVLAGVGGGVLYVPLVGAFFPFHLDFVRGAGLLVALSGALAAGPNLLRAGMFNLRLGIPVALIASTSSIAGALVGLALPTSVLQIALGGTILLICLIMVTARKSEYPFVRRADALSTALGMTGIYYERSLEQKIVWNVHRTPLGFLTFVLIGIVAGMFGLGAGWANVPALNLVMGVPLKVAVATSGFVLSVADTSAAWVYINRGAVLPLMVVPSLLGMMVGARIGSRLLTRTNSKVVRYLVISMLLLSGVTSVMKGLGLWF